MTRDAFFAHLKATRATMAWGIDTCGNLRGWYLGFPDDMQCCPITAVGNALVEDGYYPSPDLWDNAADALSLDLGFASSVVHAADNEPEHCRAVRHALLEATGLTGDL